MQMQFTASLHNILLFALASILPRILLQGVMSMCVLLDNYTKGAFYYNFGSREKGEIRTL